MLKLFLVITLFCCIAKEHQTTSPSKNVSVHDSKHLDTDNRSDSSGGNLRSDHSEKWRHYVTKTGRLTGYLIKTRNCTSSSKNEGKEIWKPAFSLNTTSSLNTYYPSLHHSAVCGLNDKTIIVDGSTSGDDGKTLEPVKGWLIFCYI